MFELTISPETTPSPSSTRVARLVVQVVPVGDWPFGVRQHVASAGERYRAKVQIKSTRNRASGPECPELGVKQTSISSD